MKLTNERCYSAATTHEIERFIAISIQAFEEGLPWVPANELANINFDISRK